MALFYYFLFVCELSSYVQAVKVENGIENQRVTAQCLRAINWIGGEQDHVAGIHRHVDHSRMLGNLRAAFYKSGDQQLLVVSITEDDARTACRRNHSKVVAALVVRKRLRFPSLTMEFFRGFRLGTSGCEVWIFHASAPCGPRAWFGAESARSTSAYSKV